ncbi:MAG: type II secretion system protein GspN [Myxococcales bacterium]|nr:type II secretion system protein GspN [Myxococcales bacterium]
MASSKLKVVRKVFAYTGFFFLAVLIAFFLTFPYDALKDRVRLEADRAGYFTRINSMGPGFFGIRAKGIELSKKVDTDPPPAPLKIDSVSGGPTLFPPGVGVTAKLFGGSVAVRVSGFSNIRVRVDAEDLNLASPDLKEFSGIDFAGMVEAHVDLSLPRVAVGPGPAEPDLGQATGTISIDAKQLAINGGSMSMVIPQFGPEPTPLDLPKIVVGDLSGKLKFEKGAGTIEKFEAKSADLELQATGTLKLAKRLEYAEPGIELRFKPDPEFQKRLGLIGSALSMVGPDPKDPSWRMGRLTGYLGRPNFR